MKFKKLSDAERTEWAEFTEQGYSEEAAHGLAEEDFWLLERITDAALDDDFDWMIDIIAHNEVEVVRCKNNPFFNERLTRAYEHGVACGHGGCCCNLGNIYHDSDIGGRNTDYAAAIELYTMGADLGDAQASVNLGYIYYYGRDTAVDYAKAYECYARAALSCGHPEALYKIGDLYASGKGVRKSDRMAWLMYSKAYENGKDTIYACRAAHHVADYLMTGIEGKLDRDPERALKLYVEAELSYYDAIDAGLTYYTKCLNQAIESQERAREAVNLMHIQRREGYYEEVRF